MKRWIISVSLILIIGLLSLNFVQARNIQGRVKPDPSTGLILGIIESSAPSSPSSVASLPKKLLIPKIGVNATVEEVGLDKQNRMDVPKKADDVGWYKLGVKPVR